MNETVDLLRSVLVRHGLVTAFAFVGLVVWLSYLVSDRLTRGRVHGYEGLVVADASCIPTTLGVNPQHTIMALARMHAEALVN